MTPRTGSRLLVFLLLCGFGASAAAQTSGAVLTREQKPVYPEGLRKIQKQGNVLLIGRIDKGGTVRDPVVIATSDLGFADPSVEAVKAWQFKPALRGGRPIEVPVNIGIRFRLEGSKRGEIPRPALGDLAVFPADAAGGKTAPEGFPIRRGGDARLRVEAVLDVAPSDKPRRLPVRAEAVSPKNRRIGVYEGTVSVPARATHATIPFTAVVRNDWEDGVWQIQFSAAGAAAGGGQFWLAGDPEHFDFAGEMARSAAAAANAPPPPPAVVRPAGTASPARAIGAAPKRTPTPAAVPRR
ncbi:MAG TPA: energy transducer TonB [Thermoanaerobaculia bacterium]|nr:energy transducer TonB [Thermoanaerobaculia bacterium]